MRPIIREELGRRVKWGSLLIIALQVVAKVSVVATYTGNPFEAWPECRRGTHNRACSQDRMKGEWGVKLRNGNGKMRKRFRVNAHGNVPVPEDRMPCTVGQVVGDTAKRRVHILESGVALPCAVQIGVVHNAPAVEAVPQILSRIGESNLGDGRVSGGLGGMGHQPDFETEVLEHPKGVDDSVVVEDQAGTPIPSGGRVVEEVGKGDGNPGDTIRSGPRCLEGMNIRRGWCGMCREEGASVSIPDKRWWVPEDCLKHVFSSLIRPVAGWN